MTRVSWRRVAAIALGFWLFYSWPTEGKGEVSLRVNPLFAMAPASFTLTIHIEPHEGNRALRYFWDGPRFESTGIELEGEKARTFYSVEIRRLPPGWYVVGATLIRWQNGKWQQFTTTTQICVIGGETSCQDQ